MQEIEALTDDEAASGGYQVWQGVVLTPEGRVEVPTTTRSGRRSWLMLTIPSSEDILAWKKRMRKVLRNWVWPRLHRDVQRYVRTCVLCQKMKHATHKTWGLCQPILAPYPWHTVTLDLVGKFTPASGTDLTYCLVIVDKFSKYVILRAVPETCDSQMVADLFMQAVVTTFGVPTKVISDRGPQFTSQLWHQLMDGLGVRVAHATSHHPQSDGQSERAIQTFLRLLRTFTVENPESWVAKLPLLQFAINDSYVESTKSTPFRSCFWA